MSFQTQVQQFPAPAVEGDFASANPRVSVLAGSGALVAGALGMVVARFGWVTNDANGNPQTAQNTAAGSWAPNGAPDGFCHRVQQGLIPNYLQESSMMVPGGFPVVLHSRSDAWVLTRTVATRGQKVFASLLDGGVSTGTAGTPVAGFVGTASFATNVMTVVTSTGGPLHVGDVVTSQNVAAGTYITSFGTGSGGVGTYNLSTSPGTITTQAASASSYVETGTTPGSVPWFVASSGAGAVGNLIRITSWGN